MTDHVVPCDGCTACCQGHQLVLLLPDDDLRLRERAVLDGNDQVIGRLQHQVNGDCAWLEGGKCAAYAFRPQVCRAFSCVGFWYGMDEAARMEVLAETGGPDDVFLAAVRLHKAGVR